MSGFYFDTEKNHYYYDNSSGEVNFVSKSCEPHIIFDSNSFIPTQAKSEEFYYDGPFSHLILVVTEECNLRCRYCAYSGIYSNQRVHSNNMMSKEIAKKAIDNYFTFFASVQRHNINAVPSIGFYGGEPLMNFEVIKYAIEYANEKYAGKISYTTTVNATLLTKEIIRFLAQHAVTLVVSLNGNKAENDRSRVFPNGFGTFDIIMEKIHYIKETYPEYFKSNVALSTTIDTGTDLLELEKFFSEEPFKTTAISLSKVADAYCDWYDQFDEKTKKRSSEQLQFMRGQFYENKRMGKPCSNVQNGLFNLLFLLILNRSLGTVNSIIPYTGACVPGSKISVDYQGNLFCCEKVNSSRPIGNVDQWLDYDLVDKLIKDYLEIIGPRCINCPANRMCQVCYKDIFDENGIGIAPPVEQCNEYIENLRNGFRMVYSLLEQGVSVEMLRGKNV